MIAGWRVLIPVGLLAGGFFFARNSAAARPQGVDLLIVNGLVVDGTNSAPRRADVAIRGDRIVAVGTTLSRAGAARVIDATGRMVSPGFIDLHAHLEPLLELPLMESALRQGVTFALGGPCLLYTSDAADE